jgi:hypothetical protein
MNIWCPSGWIVHTMWYVPARVSVLRKVPVRLTGDLNLTGPCNTDSLWRLRPTNRQITRVPRLTLIEPGLKDLSVTRTEDALVAVPAGSDAPRTATRSVITKGLRTDASTRFEMEKDAGDAVRGAA